MAILKRPALLFYITLFCGLPAAAQSASAPAELGRMEPSTETDQTLKLSPLPELPAVEKSDTTGSAATTRLNGAISRKVRGKGDDEQGEEAGGATPQLPLSILLSRSRPQLSPDEYRKMQYGVVGMHAIVTADSQGPIVTELLPSCPAALAGIQPGDVIVQAGDHIFQHGDGLRTYWRSVAGKADTTVDIIVNRKSEQLTFHLIRMNIEDIKDDRIRRMYETFLQFMGPPSQP